MHVLLLGGCLDVYLSSDSAPTDKREILAILVTSGIVDISNKKLNVKLKRL